MGIHTATQANNFYFPAGTIGTMETKMHHLHRPMSRYFADKIEQEEKEEISLMKSEKEEKNNPDSDMMNAIDAKEREVEKLRELLKSEQKKVKVCLECKRKFASADQLKRHKAESQLHKEKLAEAEKKSGAKKM